jgi:ADP-ribosyl-[dinitrogen reductase] hydrolase
MGGVSSQPIPERFPVAFQFWFLHASGKTRFEQTHAPFCGSTDPRTAGNGSIMRLAPVPLFYVQRPPEAIERAGESSRTTHGAREAIDGCRYLAALLVGAIQGVPKTELLSHHISPVQGLWKEAPLSPKIAAIASGSFKPKNPPAICGTGYVVDCLEAALWAFHRSNTFRQGALLAVNLGDDSDTPGAVHGQLAGAYYGEHSIPESWRSRLARHGVIRRYADELLALSQFPDFPIPRKEAPWTCLE